MPKTIYEVYIQEEDEKFKIKFPYNELLLKRIRSLIPSDDRSRRNGYGWNDEDKYWTFPLDYQEDVISLISKFEHHDEVQFVYVDDINDLGEVDDEEEDEE